MTFATNFPARIVDRVVNGERSGRGQRYVQSWIAGATLIWVLALGYMLLTPKTYTSRFTFVLPGTGAGSSLNLNDIGEASSTADSAFSTPDISPTENYREILLSDQVLGMAAQTANMPVSSFPKPRVELVQQTKLITVTVRARRPQRAQDLANDLSTAFLITLDNLRDGELRARDDAAINMVAVDRASLEERRAHS